MSCWDRSFNLILNWTFVLYFHYKWKYVNGKLNSFYLQKRLSILVGDPTKLSDIKINSFDKMISPFFLFFYQKVQNKNAWIESLKFWQFCPTAMVFRYKK